MLLVTVVTLLKVFLEHMVRSQLADGSYTYVANTAAAEALDAGDTK